MSSKQLPGKPLMIVMSSPSGGGKSTLCRMLLSEYDNIEYSISCTTRKPRGNEVDGVSYHFMDTSEFNKNAESGFFLEYAEVHGNMYGTLQKSVEEALSCGKSVILDIDVQGARQIRTRLSGSNSDLAKSYVDIFITPPSLEELKRRLEKRGEDSADTIDLRLKNAAREMNCASEYRYVIENNELDEAYNRLKEILEEESLA